MSRIEPSEETASSWQSKLSFNDGISENNKKNVVLLNQIVPFILNTSHYMTDLMYILYYLAQNQDNKRPNADGTCVSHKEELLALKNDLCELIYDLRTGFRLLLDSCELDHFETPGKCRHLIEKVLVTSIYGVNGLISQELGRLNVDFREEFVLQLQNCLLGFVNLYKFLNKIPMNKQQSQMNDLQMKILVNVLQNELLPIWKFQLDLLNCKLFNELSKDKNMVKMYREATNDTEIDVSKGEPFIKYVNWLKDQIIGEMTV
ncbi:hypothetical protein N7582_003164 [Saccharomyces uvarum]|uniref:YJR011C-like protein n=1 Tax=Saccharomyces uvarum TaxID=230603 RepID=A0AA35J2I5_SACUV|nr:hypothetical protein N7582_003164 [Saccharomyces uvarum]CAI4044252.1 hypothetical protein SUVC_10G1480 [Saccharomyces uvarum]